MKKVINLITTYLTVVMLSLAVGMLLGYIGAPGYVGGLVGLCIGFFGSQIIYKWLSKSDTQSDTNVESEE